MPRHHSRENDLKIAEYYLSGRTSPDIGAELGISADSVRNALRRQSIPLRKGGPVPSWAGTAEQQSLVLAKYESGMGIKAIARELGCGDTRVTKVLADAGIERRPFGAEIRAFTDAEARSMAAEYLAGETLASLGRKYRLSHVTIGQWLKRVGVATRPPTTPHFWTEEKKAEAVSRYQNGEPYAEIASAMGISKTGVYGVLRTAGVIRKKDQRRTDNGNWRGGRVQVAGGYVAVAPGPEDMPYVDRLRSGGYIAEHRLVMARHLGRPLRPGETVHHKDGIRDHNDIGNLQLRQRAHGEGVRAVCLDCGSHNIGHDEL